MDSTDRLLVFETYANIFNQHGELNILDTTNNCGIRLFPNTFGRNYLQVGQSMNDSNAVLILDRKDTYSTPMSLFGVYSTEIWLNGLVNVNGALVTPPVIATVDGSYVPIDFSKAALQTEVVTGDVTIYLTNAIAGAEAKLWLLSDSSAHNVTFAAPHRWGCATPTQVAAWGWLLLDCTPMDPSTNNVVTMATASYSP